MATPHRVVVLVEDDPAVLSSLKFALELDGYRVRAYTTAESVLRDAESFGNCCFVIDQNLAGIEGLDVLAALRARGLQDPAILLISTANEKLRARAAKALVPIVEKPFLTNELFERIRTDANR